MLVITRKTEQSVFIGDDIVVKILAVQGTDRVKLGISAPDDVLILREELDDAN